MLGTGVKNIFSIFFSKIFKFSGASNCVAVLQRNFISMVSRELFFLTNIFHILDVRKCDDSGKKCWNGIRDKYSLMSLDEENCDCK